MTFQHGAESTDSSDGSTSSFATGSDPEATRRRRRARVADKRPHRALVKEALRAFRREQREDTVVEPRFKGLLSPERYRLAQRGGRLHLPRGNSIRGIRADVKALMHTRPYHTYIVSRCFYRCKCLNSRTRRQQGGWHPHPNEQLSR